MKEIAKPAGTLALSNPPVAIASSHDDDYDPETVPIGWDAFCAAAKRLKAAELEYKAAQQAYADAVKQLSEEACK